MKKLLAVVLVVGLAMGICGGAFAVETEQTPGDEIHLPWGVPFGISLKEFRSAMREKTGVEFEQAVSDSSGEVALVESLAGTVTMCGYPATIHSRFKDGLLIELWISFSSDIMEETAGVERLCTLYNLLSEKYGVPSVARLDVYDIEDAITDENKFILPITDGRIDDVRMQNAVANYDKTVIQSFWNNVYF